MHRSLLRHRLRRPQPLPDRRLMLRRRQRPHHKIRLELPVANQELPVRGRRRAGRRLELAPVRHVLGRHVQGQDDQHPGYRPRGRGHQHEQEGHE